MTAALAIQVRKEVRELLPWWASLGALGLIGMSSRTWGITDAALVVIGLLAFAAGVIALGANIFGHEFTNRTMAGLLALPVRRGRLLAVKLGVLIVMVAILAAVMWLVSLGYPFTQHVMQEAGLVIAALSIGVAPCLTLVFRSALAGAVFTAVTPLLFYLAGLWVPDWTSKDVELLTKQGSLFVSGAGLVVTCLLFQRFEAVDGPVSQRGAAGWFRRTALDVKAPAGELRLHHPVVAIIRKELRLQRTTLLLSVLFAAAWLLSRFAVFVDPEPTRLSIIFPLTAIHGVVVSAMAGALAFAEERQLGTWQSQVLLPISASTQSRVKIAVALSLALLLALGLPQMLNVIAPAPDAIAFDEFQIVGVLAIGAAALYVSSASSSGLRALLTMLPFTVLVMLLSGFFSEVGREEADLFRNLLPRLGGDFRVWREVLTGVTLASLTAGTVFMLVLAHKNHQTADRSHWRFTRQVLRLSGLGFVAVTVYQLVAVIGSAGAR